LFYYKIAINDLQTKLGLFLTVSSGSNQPLSMKILITTVLAFFFVFNTIVAQSNLNIGEWKSHLPYKLSHDIAQDESRIYFTTESALFTINKDDGQTEFFSKVDGLSDIGSNIIKYDQYNDVLLMVYANSNLDIISQDEITNLPFILTSQAVGDKQVYDVFVDSESVTYLAMGFGLKVLNVKNKEFGDEVRAEIRFNSVTVFNNYIYAATDEGIYRVERTPTVNIQDFSEWEWLGDSAGFPNDYSSNKLIVFKDKLYTDVNDVLMSYDGVSLDSVYAFEENLSLRFLSGEGQRLIVGMKCCMPSDNCDCDALCDANCKGKVLFFETDGSYIESGDGCVNYPLRVAADYESSCSLTDYNSPLTKAAADIEIVNNTVLVATQLSGRDPKFVGDGYFQLKDGEWTNYSLKNNGVLTDLVAFVDVAINPSNNKAYIGTLWDGLIEMVDGVPTQRFNATNSHLEPAIGDQARVRITALDFDKDDNLWVANHSTSRPISVLDSEGVWDTTFLDIPETGLRFLAIDGFGYKWFSVDGSSQALLVYDNGGTLRDTTDDRLRRFSSSNTVLPNNTVFSIAADLDGDVWVGTNEGVVIFECSGNVFDGSCQGSRRVVEVGGYNNFLLGTQEVRAIAVDGANRKWVGTNNGVFVFSPDGRTQLAFFDTNNSPLFNNKINGIAVNQQTGEVFISTASGLLSYQSDAQEGGPVNSKSAYAYPNPVKPGYEGPIAIKGLARDANVKITDVNGQLVYETKSFGGQAIWDGKDYNGRKVNSGVYIVFSTGTQNIENPDAIATKILFIN